MQQEILLVACPSKPLNCTFSVFWRGSGGRIFLLSIRNRDLGERPVSSQTSTQQPPQLFCVIAGCTQRRAIEQQKQKDRKTRIFSLDNYGQKTRWLFFLLFAPLRLRRNNFSCAIMRLTIEREREDSDNAFTIDSSMCLQNMCLRKLKN